MPRRNASTSSSHRKSGFACGHRVVHDLGEDVGVRRPAGGHGGVEGPQARGLLHPRRLHGPRPRRAVDEQLRRLLQLREQVGLGRAVLVDARREDADAEDAPRVGEQVEDGTAATSTAAATSAPATKRPQRTRLAPGRKAAGRRPRRPAAASGSAASSAAASQPVTPVAASSPAGRRPDPCRRRPPRRIGLAVVWETGGHRRRVGGAAPAARVSRPGRRARTRRLRRPRARG